jgi:GPH family glycoside/pentoside/hexuronide:cation symporter
MFQTGLPFYITVLMKLDSGMSFVLFALMTGISLIFYAPVNILAKKFGKKKIVQWAFIAFAGVFTLTTFCGLGGIGGMAWGVIVSALAAIPMAALGILPQAIVADIAEADRITTGENRQGMFYAARTFAFKLGQSVAMLIFTSLAKVGSNGFGYRLSAVVAAVLCLAGGLVFFAYNEKATIATISAASENSAV